MLNFVALFLAFLIIIWYVKSSIHPKSFPPGPRRPLPVIGDTYVMGGDLALGFRKLKEKYGKMFGLWLGKKRCVCVADFDILQELLNKSETANRVVAPAVGNIFKISMIPLNIVLHAVENKVSLAF